MLETYLPKIKEFILTYGVKVLGALAVLIIGWIVIKWVTKFIGKMIDRKGIDVSLKPFF